MGTALLPNSRQIGGLPNGRPCPRPERRQRPLSLLDDAAVGGGQCVARWHSLRFGAAKSQATPLECVADFYKSRTKNQPRSRNLGVAGNDLAERAVDW